MSTMNELKKCGFCGRYYRGKKFVKRPRTTAKISLGNCPNAQEEWGERFYKESD